MFLTFIFLLQVWFQNRRARLRRQKKKDQCRSPSYEELSPPSSVDSSSSSLEPSSPQQCPWATYASTPTAQDLKIPTVPTPPSSPCKEACCSPPAICLSFYAYNDLSLFKFVSEASAFLDHDEEILIVS